MSFIKKPTLRLSITTVFIGLFAIAVGTIVAYTHIQTSKAIFNLSDDIIAQASKTAMQKTENFLQPLISIAELTKHTKGADAKNPKLVAEPLGAYFTDVLKAHPELYSFFIGYEDGSFIQTIQLPPGSGYKGGKEGSLPEGTTFARRLLLRDAKGGATRWTYYNDQGEITDEEFAPTATYDPRQRPWYKGAKEKGGRYWTDLYAFSSSKNLGTTASFPLVDDAGHTYGVIGADLALGEISKFLSQQKVGNNGIIFLFDDQGQMVAHPEEDKLLKEIDGVLGPVTLDEISDDWVWTASIERDDRGKDKFIFPYRGKDYIASFTKFPTDLGRSWTIGIIVPVDDFVGALKKTVQETLYLSLGISVLVMFAIWIVSLRISTPITRLANETQKIMRFELDEAVEVRSKIREIDALSTSLGNMKTAIRSFTKYVPKALVSNLIETGVGVELGGKRQNLTIFFSDVTDFSGISEEMAPEALMHHMADYLNAVSNVIHDHHGTIDKYIGDAVMAIWGAPIDDADHAAHACMAALYSREAVHVFNAQARENGQPPLLTRFGLHTGDTVVGNVGSSDRMNYTVLGDSVNLASRLEGLNKKYNTEIIVSSATVLAAGKGFVFCPIDSVTVRGKKKVTFIYELVGTHEGPFPVSTEDLAAYQDFDQAYKTFLSREWDKAEAMFTYLSKTKRMAYLASLYIDRCQEMAANPPDDDWIGVYQIRNK